LEPRSIKRGSPCGQCVVAHHAVVSFVRADRTYAALIMQSRALSTTMDIPQMALPLFVRVGNCTDELAIASLLLFDLEIYCRFLAVIVLNLIFNVLSFIE
jgi:hypothetical protein